MTHFFEKRDRWGNRLSLWLVVLMAFVTPMCWWSLRHIRLENDVEKWLPESDPEVQAIHWTHEQFPVDERVLLTWEGSSINDARIGKLVEQLIGRPDTRGVMRGGLPYIASVVEPQQTLIDMQQNGIEPREAVRRLEGTILGAGPLRLRLTESGRTSLKKTKREIQTAVKAKLGFDIAVLDASPDLTPLVLIPTPAEKGSGLGEPSAPAVLSVEGKLLDQSAVDHDLQVSWKGIHVGSENTITVAKWLTEYIPERGDGKPLVDGAFFALGSPVALAIGISEAGLADKAETLTAIRSACRVAGISGESLHMAGSTVSTSELNTEVVKAAWNVQFPITEMHRRSVLLTSALVSVLLAYALLRSVRLATLVLVVSLFTTYCSLAVVSATGGSLNMVSIVMPTLLVVMTMSGAIHVLNYWKHAVSRNESTAIVETVRTSMGPCFLASLTTAIGLASLCTSRLSPVREFGLYAGAAALFSMVAVVYGLPALMQLWSGKPPRPSELNHPGWRAFGKMLMVRPGWQSLGVLAVCLGFSVGLYRFRTETKVIRYFSERARITQDFSYIESNLSGIMPVDMVVRFDDQSQKDTNFLDRMELIRKIQSRMWEHSEISGSTSLASFLPISEAAPADAGFLQKSRHTKHATIVQQRIRDGEIPFARSYYTIAEHTRNVDGSRDGRLNDAGDELWRISAQVNVMNDNDFSKLIDDLHRIARDELKLQPGSQHSITGAVPLLVRTQQAVLQSLISSFGLTFALIFTVFVVTLRNFWAAMISMIPNVVPITVVFGIISWTQQRIDIGSMITASIALGIAVDGTLHYLTWVRRSMAKGSTRQAAIVEALVQCGPALWQTNLAIAIGLLVLVPAELKLIGRFGWLMASMIGVAFVGNVVLMPQLLGTFLGRFFEPGNFSVDAPVVNMEEPAASTTELARESMESTEESISHGKLAPSPHIKALEGSTRKKRRPTA